MLSISGEGRMIHLRLVARPASFNRFGVSCSGLYPRLRVSFLVSP